MATRMQQRRGTAAEWTAADPVLAAGEIGYETDTNQFKIGDGTTAWSSLNYFKTIEGLDGSGLATEAELAAAIAQLELDVEEARSTAITNAIAAEATDRNTAISNAISVEGARSDGYADQAEADAIAAAATQSATDISTHSAVTTNVHGIADTSVLATQNDVSTAQTAAELHADDLVGDAAIDGTPGNTVVDRIDTEIGTHNSTTQNVHGIADTSVLATDSDVSSAISTHNADTTNVHGIADTSVLATDSDVSAAQSAAQTYADGLAVNYDAAGSASTAQAAAQSFATTAVDNHSADTTGVHGIADTSLLVTTAGATFLGKLTLDGDPTQALHAATKQYVDSAQAGLSTKPQVVAASTANVSGTYDNGTDGVGATLNLGQLATLDIDGVTSWDLLDGILLKDQTDASENGRWVVDQIGNGTDTDWILRRCSLCDTADEIPGAYIFVIDGTTNSQTGWVLHVDNPSTFTVGTDDITAYQFAGAGSVTAGTNMVVSGNEVSLSSDPTMTDATITNLDITNLVFADGTQTKAGVPSITPIAEKTASYTLSSTDERDTIVEVNSASATTLTIPTDATLNFPVGTTLDVIQTGAGQVTIAGDIGVTVNATPGLKLRAQWSSVTLLKRAANSWLVFGDTSA